jgi:hypothetical protein
MTMIPSVRTIAVTGAALWVSQQFILPFLLKSGDNPGGLIPVGDGLVGQIVFYGASGLAVATAIKLVAKVG